MDEFLGFVVLAGPLFYLCVFFIVSVVIVIVARKIGRRHGKPWGSRAALALLLLMFWDFPPTAGMFWYQCSVNGGFTQYKTIEEWKSENPGVASTLDPEAFPEEFFIEERKGTKKSKRRYYRFPDGTELISYFDVSGAYSRAKLSRKNGSQGVWLNNRFTMETKVDSFPLRYEKRTVKIVDVVSGDTLAKHVDFGLMPTEAREGYGWNFRQHKFWLNYRTCGMGEAMPGRVDFNGFMQLVRLIGSSNYGSE